MQNSGNKVINLKSELLFREAEDDFFYFNKTDWAYKKLLKAVELTPSHTKSLMLLADICFIKGNIKNALEYYKTAQLYSGNKSKVYASIANCLYVLNDYEMAVSYVEKALSLLKVDDLSLQSQLVEIQINSLFELKRYKEATALFIKHKNFIENSSNNFEIINEKLQKQKKLKRINLRVL